MDPRRGSSGYRSAVKDSSTRRYGACTTAIEKSASAAWFPNDIGRFGRPEEVAAAVTFLAGRHAAYISGADIRVDGGTVRTVS